MLLLTSFLSAANASDLALSLATASIVICPALCGVMAYRVSRAYANLRAS